MSRSEYIKLGTLQGLTVRETVQLLTPGELYDLWAYYLQHHGRLKED